MQLHYKLHVGEKTVSTLFALCSPSQFNKQDREHILDQPSRTSSQRNFANIDAKP